MRVPHAEHHSDIIEDVDAPTGPQLSTSEHSPMCALPVNINMTGNADTVPELDTSSETEDTALADDTGGGIFSTSSNDDTKASPWSPDVAILIGGDFILRPTYKPEKGTVGTAGGDNGISSTSSGGEVKVQDSTWCPDATVMIRGNYSIKPIHKRGKGNDGIIEPNSLEVTNVSKENPAQGDSDIGVRNVINIDGAVASMRKHPFRALVASPLMLIAATSLALFAVTASLCDVIVRPGEYMKPSGPQDKQFDRKKPSGPQDDQTSSEQKP